MMLIQTLILMETPRIGAKRIGTAAGLFFAAAEIGGFGGPFLLGFLRDLTGSLTSGVLILAVVSGSVDIDLAAAERKQAWRTPPRAQPRQPGRADELSLQLFGKAEQLRQAPGVHEEDGIPGGQHSFAHVVYHRRQRLARIYGLKDDPLLALPSSVSPRHTPGWGRDSPAPRSRMSR